MGTQFEIGKAYVFTRSGDASLTYRIKGVCEKITDKSVFFSFPTETGRALFCPVNSNTARFRLNKGYDQIIGRSQWICVSDETYEEFCRNHR